MLSPPPSPAHPHMYTFLFLPLRTHKLPKHARSPPLPSTKSVLCPMPTLLRRPPFAGQLISVSFTDVLFGLLRKVLFSLLFALNCVSTSAFYLSPSLAELLKWKACFLLIHCQQTGQDREAEKSSNLYGWWRITKHSQKRLRDTIDQEKGLDLVGNHLKHTHGREFVRWLRTGQLLEPRRTWQSSSREFSQHFSSERDRKGRGRSVTVHTCGVWCVCVWPPSLLSVQWCAVWWYNDNSLYY